MSIIDTLEHLLDNDVEAEGGMQKAEGSFPPVNQPANNNSANFIKTGSSVTTKEPYTSVTETYTENKHFPKYEDWGNMTGNESWDDYSKKLGITKPVKPDLDENREKRLSRHALLNDIGQGLYTLGEAFGLSKGASVRARNIPQSPQLAEIDTARKESLLQSDRYNKMLQNYYNIAHDYESARQKRYLEERKESGTKTSITTTNGGGSVTDKYANPKWEAQEQKNKEKLAWIRKTPTPKGGKEEKWNTYAIGNTGRKYSYHYGKDEGTLATAANYARNALRTTKLPDGISERVLSSVKGKYGIRDMESLLDNRAYWQMGDNRVFTTEMVSGLLEYKRGLEAALENMSKPNSRAASAQGELEKKHGAGKVMDFKKYYTENLMRIYEVLDGIQDSGFLIEE